MPNASCGPEIFEHNPIRIAHRGASKEAPENTLPAFSLAIQKYQVDMVEMDLQLTQDGVPVVFHDLTLERVTEGQGLLSKHSLAQLKTLDAGFGFDPTGKKEFPFRGKGAAIPTLEEVLTEFPNACFCLEIKEKRIEAVQKILEVIGRIQRKGRLLLASFDGKTARKLRRLAPPTMKGILAEDEIFWMYTAHRLGFSRFNPPAHYASLPLTKYRLHLDDKNWIDFLHRQGVRVFYWTVNEPEEMRRLLKLGADGILTDDPAGLNQVLEKS